MFLAIANAAGSELAGAQSFLEKINWTSPSWDLFIILFFIVSSFIYGLALEKDKIIVILISIYMSLAVFNVSPLVGAGGASSSLQQFFTVRIGIFLAIFIAIFFLLSYSVNLRAIARAGLDKWWEVVVFSFLHVGLLISIILSFLPAEIIDQLSFLTRYLFADSLARFLWMIAPIAAIVLIRSKK